jgi:hypothetical protein
MVMAGKRTRTTRVPSHLRFAARFPPSTTTGSERNTTSPKTWVADVSRVSQAAKSGIPPIASECVVLARDPSGLVLRIRGDDGDLAAGAAEVVVRSGGEAKQLPRLADFDSPFRNDFQLVAGCHRSAVRSRHMVNSMAPSGSSRHRSTSLI